MTIEQILLAIIIILISIIGYFLRDKFINLDKVLIAVKNNIKLIADSLVKAPIKFDHTKLEHYSPLRLTEVGKKWLEEIGFVEIFNNHTSEFIAFIDVEKPTTKYDVEVSATKSFLFLSDKEYFKPIKEYLYNHPKENLNSISKTVGIYIRDKYLENHPEITS